MFKREMAEMKPEPTEEDIDVEGEDEDTTESLRVKLDRLEEKLSEGVLTNNEDLGDIYDQIRELEEEIKGQSIILQSVIDNLRTLSTLLCSSCEPEKHSSKCMEGQSLPQTQTARGGGRERRRTRRPKAEIVGLRVPSEAVKEALCDE